MSIILDGVSMVITFVPNVRLIPWVLPVSASARESRLIVGLKMMVLDMTVPTIPSYATVGALRTVSSMTCPMIVTDPGATDGGLSTVPLITLSSLFSLFGVWVGALSTVALVMSPMLFIVRVWALRSVVLITVST